MKSEWSNPQEARMTGVGAANPRENKAWLKDEWAEANDGKAKN